MQNAKKQHFLGYLSGTCTRVSNPAAPTEFMEDAHGGAQVVRLSHIQLGVGMSRSPQNSQSLTLKDASVESENLEAFHEEEQESSCRRFAIIKKTGSQCVRGWLEKPE